MANFHRLRITSDGAGIFEGRVLAKGDEIDVEPGFARLLIVKGHATEIDRAPEAKTADKRETATAKKREKR